MTKHEKSRSGPIIRIPTETGLLYRVLEEAEDLETRPTVWTRLALATGITRFMRTDGRRTGTLNERRGVSVRDLSDRIGIEAKEVFKLCSQLSHSGLINVRVSSAEVFVSTRRTVFAGSEYYCGNHRSRHFASSEKQMIEYEEESGCEEWGLW